MSTNSKHKPITSEYNIQYTMYQIGNEGEGEL